MKGRVLIVTATVASVALGILAGPGVLRRLPVFQVRRIELAGARYLEPETVARALRLAPGASIYDDLEPLERRVGALPGVKEARVTRRLPGALRVTVREAEPVALIRVNGRLALMDAQGRRLPFDPTDPAEDLPLAQADSAVGGLITRLRQTDPALHAQIESAARVRGSLVLDAGGRRLVFRPDATSEEIRAVVAVAGDLERRGRSWQELDARWVGRVVVRHRGSGS